MLDTCKLAFGAMTICLAVYMVGRLQRLLLERLTNWVIDRWLLPSDKDGG